MEGLCNPAIVWIGLLHYAWIAGLNKVLSGIGSSISSMPPSTNKFGFTPWSSPEDASDQSPEADEYQTNFALEYYVEEVTR